MNPWSQQDTVSVALLLDVSLVWWGWEDGGAGSVLPPQATPLHLAVTSSTCRRAWSQMGGGGREVPDTSSLPPSPPSRPASRAALFLSRDTDGGGFCWCHLVMQSNDPCPRCSQISHC